MSLTTRALQRTICADVGGDNPDKAMTRKYMHGALLVMLLSAQPAPCFAQAREDLTRALDAGVGRRISSTPNLATTRWTKVGAPTNQGGARLQLPASLCWLNGRLVVADQHRQQLLVLSPEGTVERTIGRRGAAQGEFAALSMVRCSAGKAALLTADLGLHRVSFFDASGALLRSTTMPDVPQIDILGEFGLADDGSWYDSWLGSDVTFGPYLSNEQWRGVGLVRRYGKNDSLLGWFGRPRPYRDRVARRVLNRVFLTVHRDTVWTLTQGDATIRGFTRDGRSTGPDILLPVYFRGAEPKVTLGKGRPESEFVPNRMEYDPNVADVAVIADSLFAVARYRDWGLARVPRHVPRMAASSIEIVDRRGRVLRAYGAPGMVIAIESDGRSRLAIITRTPNMTQHVYVAQLTF